MLYGYQDTIENKPVTIVTAADSVEELEVWASKVLTPDSSDVWQNARATNFRDHLQDPRFQGYKHPVYVFEHNAESQRQDFVVKNEIKLVKSMPALDLHKDMMQAKKEQLAAAAAGGPERRTLAEIHGLTVDDPWDKRTPEEKKAAEEGEKRVDELRKRFGDRMSGQSFDPNPRGIRTDDGLSVRDIKLQEDGSVDVGAAKGAQSVGINRDALNEVFQKKAPSQVELAKQTGLAIAALEGAGYSELEVQSILKEVEEMEGSNDAADFLENLKKKVAEKIAQNHATGPTESPADIERINREIAEAEAEEDNEKITAGTKSVIAETPAGLPITSPQLSIKAPLSTEEIATREVLIERVEKAYDKIESISDEIKTRIRQNIMNSEATLDEVTKVAEKSIAELEKLANAPQPKPEDYLFAFNQRLTDNPAIGGENTPVFSFSINKLGPHGGQFGLKYLDIMLPGLDKRFEMVSAEIYVFNSDAVEGRNILLKAGFVEDISIIPGLVSRGTSVKPPKPKFSPKEFADALAGNGTSTMSGTDSFGAKVVGRTEDEVIEDTKKEEKVRGITMDALAGAEEITFDALPAEIKNLYGADLEDKTIKIGPYNGHVQLGERVVIPTSANTNDDRDGHRIIGEINVRHLGTTVLGEAKVDIYVREPHAKKGYVIVQSKVEKKQVWIMEIR